MSRDAKGRATAVRKCRAEAAPGSKLKRCGKPAMPKYHEPMCEEHRQKLREKFGGAEVPRG